VINADRPDGVRRLPGIGTVMTSGSALVSTMATTGIPSLLASRTAIRSFFASTTKSAPGRPAQIA
jgi:hypothetical protein